MKHATHSEPTSGSARRMGDYFLALRRQVKRYRAATLSVMCVVVFATTYALILPAITIDQSTAANQAGMSVASSSASESSASPAASSAQDAAANAATDTATDAAAVSAQVEEQQPESAAEEPQAADATYGGAASHAVQTPGSSNQTAAATLAANEDGYQVTVDFGADAGIAEGSTLSIREYAQDSAEYQAAKQKVVEAKKAAGEQVDEDTLGFAAFDISILDKDGNKVEPANGAQVSVKLTASNLPEEVEAESLQVQHIKNDASGDVETVADATNTDKDTVLLDGTTAKADFTVSSFSTFTLTYSGYFESSSFNRIRVVDENGDSLGADNAHTITGSSVTLESLASYANPDSNTYEFVSARVGTSFANAASTTFASGTIGYSSWYRSWYYRTSTFGSHSYFDDNDTLYLVYKQADATLSFNLNGGSGTTPSSISGKAGNTVILPTYDGTRDGYTFLGWTDTANLMGDVNYHPIHSAGSEYVLTAGTTTLYAAWSNNNGMSRADFYVQLNGTIPTEPGNYSSANYTSGIAISNNVKNKHWIVDTSWTSVVGPNAQNSVSANQNSLPTVDQLVTVINGSASKLGFTVENSNGELVVASITDAATNAQSYNVSEGDALYVLWYAQKYQYTGFGIGNTWHIDGVLLVKNKVAITYVKNADDQVSNMPSGYQVPENTQVIIGADASPNGTVMTPTRTGYNFLDWNTAADGSGTSYSNNATLTLTQNTTLYAQWDKKTTGVTVYKVDQYNTSKYLSGATFKLTKKNGDAYEAVKIDGVTDDNGVLTVSDGGTRLTGLDDGTYRLTETAAPSGYIVTNPSVEFTVTDGVAQNFGSSTDTAWLVNNNRLTIKNTPGTALPTTGGTGTWMYYAAGAAFVLIALIGDFVLRRRSHGKEGCAGPRSDVMRR